jgi:hypothetical protein
LNSEVSRLEDWDCLVSTSAERGGTSLHINPRSR